MKPQQLDDFDLMLVRRIKSMLWLGRRHPRSPGYYRDAGLTLALLKGDRSRELWMGIVKEHVGISVRRAYELMVIANQTMPLAVVRAAHAARMRKHRKSKWLPAKVSAGRGQKGPDLPDVVHNKEQPDGQSTEVRLPRDRQPPTRRQDHP